MVQGFYTLDDFARHCLNHSAQIYVWAKVNGHWELVALSDLDEEGRSYYINRWWDQGHLPVMIIE